MDEPTWANVKFPPIDYQNICYYSAPKKKQELKSLDEVDPELRRTFEKLGVPIEEQKRLANVAVDVAFDSVSLGTTFQNELKKAGVVLCSISEAIRLTRKFATAESAGFVNAVLDAIHQDRLHLIPSKENNESLTPVSV